MLARRSLRLVALLCAGLAGCAGRTKPGTGFPPVAAHLEPPPPTALGEGPREIAPLSPAIAAAPDDAPLPAPAPDGPIVVGIPAPLALTAKGFPRIDRARRVVTVADTGDDRYAFQASLSLVDHRPGTTRGQAVFEVFSRERFEALEQDTVALEREIRRAAHVANTKLGTQALGRSMSVCTVASRETDDGASCAAGQSVRCDGLTATFDGRAGLLRHPRGTTRHPLWAQTSLRSREHARSFDVVACFREAAWDAETQTLAARIDRQCVASGGDWCSREPLWTVVALPPG